MFEIFSKFSGELISFLFCLAIFALLHIHSPQDERTTDTALCFWLKPYNRSNLNILYCFIRNIPNFELGLEETENNKFSFLSPAFRKEG